MKKENKFLGILRRVWRQVNSTRLRQVFFFSLVFLVFLLLINIALQQHVIFIISTFFGAIAVLASLFQTLQNKALFNREISKLRSEYLIERGSGSAEHDLNPRNKNPFSEREQEFINKRLRKYNINILIHIVFIILLGVLLFQLV
ncbi:MAG: hypothetical protein FWE45_03075 [Firmicutes bacterium]|nr:hypothetical protein [Bacillota bacterium]